MDQRDQYWLNISNGCEKAANEKQKKCINDAGIKIVFIDSAADFDCVQELATDNEVAGRTDKSACLKCEYRSS